MNETELDRLLNSWESPAPPKSMRDRLRTRFPHVERNWLPRPLRWGLVTLFASAVLTVAVAQTSNSWGSPIHDWFGAFHQGIALFVNSHRSLLLTTEIRQSQPKVYVDGQLAGPLNYGNGRAFRIQVPGGDVYAVMFFRVPERFQESGHLPGPWVKAGLVHDNLIEFAAGTHQVRIECNTSLSWGGNAVYVMREEPQAN